MGEEVKVKVSSDVSGVQSGLASVQKSIDEFREQTVEGFKDVGKEFAGMFAVGAILEGLHSVFEQMERIDKLAIRFGESAESMQRIGEAARLDGTDLEAVAKAMKVVTVDAVEAGSKGGELDEAFKTLGLSASQFADLPLQEKLLDLADGFEGSNSSAIKMAAAQKILGKSAGDLIPMLKLGREELERQFAGASVASNETVEKIAQANEKIITVFNTLKVWGADAIGYIYDKFEKLGEMIAITATFIGVSISKGLGEGRRAADQLEAGYIADRDKAEADRDRQNAGSKKTEEIQAQQAAEAEKQKKAEQAQQELTNLEAQNEAKKEDYYERHITWAQHELDLKKKLIELDAADKKGGTKEDKLKRDNERMDATKELEKVQGDIAKWQEKQDDEAKKAAQKAAREKAKAETEAKKEELQKAEAALNGLDKAKGFTVDSLRQIGGGYAGVNYNRALSGQDMQKQLVVHAKEQVELLKKAVQALENNQKSVYASSGDGSFSF